MATSGGEASVFQAYEDTMIQLLPEGCMDKKVSSYLTEQRGYVVVISLMQPSSILHNEGHMVQLCQSTYEHLNRTVRVFVHRVGHSYERSVVQGYWRPSRQIQQKNSRTYNHPKEELIYNLLYLLLHSQGVWEQPALPTPSSFTGSKFALILLAQKHLSRVTIKEL